MISTAAPPITRAIGGLVECWDILIIDDIKTSQLYSRMRVLMFPDSGWDARRVLQLAVDLS
jgi:hypothetical protein